jgi:hypothetical protein
MFPDKNEWNRIYEAIDKGLPPPWQPTQFHLPQQDKTSRAWNDLLQLIEDAARDKREVFAPKRELGPALWSEIVTLPSSIALLKNVKTLDLYRSSLLVIPPEIGKMDSLTEFIPYTSYGLHWFPYEITRCKRLQSSTVSTRALYGNYKYRPPFPNLDTPVRELIPRSCSVCGVELVEHKLCQVWISSLVATDVLPLLVNACSEACVQALPTPPHDYVQHVHTGGPEVLQPLATR